MMNHPLSQLAHELLECVTAMARAFAAWGAGLDGVGMTDNGVRLSAHVLPSRTGTGQRPPGVPE
ncbi:MAG: hypothetical protein ACX94A_05155 [Algiphilus sp.]